jgi:hypothetical protein
MSITIKSFRNINKIFEYLDSLSIGTDDYIFRGHRDKEWTLQTTLHRHRKYFVSFDVEEMIKKFRANLVKIGIRPFENGNNNRLNWLEYARHYGVPTPCIDFTHSPYIALFFAFTGAVIKYGKNSDFVYVYALNQKALAHDWAYNINTSPPAPKTHHDIYEDFLNQPLSVWYTGYPMGELFLIPYSSSYTQRILRQQGLLLYDTIDYNGNSMKDLEGYISKINEPSGSKETLIKIKIPKKFVSAIFERLEMMGITGGNLFVSQEGAQIDIMNSYHYNTKTSNLRDIDFDNA